MPSYLQRVVTSGARTAPTARPPVAIAPPMPALARSIPLIDVPAPPDVAPGRSGAPVNRVEMPPTSASPAHVVPSIQRPPPAAGRPHGIGASAAARRDELARADAGTAADAPLPTYEGTPAQGRARDDDGAGGGAPAAGRLAVAGSDDHAGDHDAVIRAPRGLRPDAGVPAVMVEMASALKSAIPRLPGAALPPLRMDRGAPATPPSGVAAAGGGSGPASMRRELPPASSGDVAHGGGASAPSAPRVAGADDAAATSRREIARLQSAPAPAPGSPRGGASADARSWLLPAEPSAAAVPVAPRAHEREHRITIGRIDVEVHNEAPAAPPVPAAGRREPSSRGARVASRFLLKP